MVTDTPSPLFQKMFSNKSISKTLSPTERNYEIYDQELLAIIQALEEWRHYIQGSAHITIILSDPRT